MTENPARVQSSIMHIVGQNRLLLTALGLSLALHIVVMAVLFIRMPATHTALAKASSQKIVKAVAINQTDVEQEIVRIQQQEQAQQRQREQEMAHYRQAVANAQQHKANMQKKIAELNHQQKAMDAKISQAKRLAEQQAKDAALKQQKVAELKKKEQQLQQRIAERKKQEQEKLEMARKLAAQKALAEQLKSEQQHLTSVAEKAAANEIAACKARIVAAIGRSWIVPKKTDKDKSCQLLIQLGPGGVVLDVKTIKSSGDAVLDRSALTAVIKASPLP
ncbi:MAG: TonB family protein, partial [Coxiellaceae bacterium]|nr:TonB family protein [Coxiellaceae bacterium]